MRPDTRHMEPTKSTIPYVCMPGSPYAGSTLLGFLLNSHPRCVSVGAATGLTARVDASTYRCSCGALFMRCAFWREVRSLTIALGHAVDIDRSNFWSTHVRVSRNRALNGLLVRSLGSPRLTAARDAVIGQVPSIRTALTEARASTLSLARAVVETSGKQVFVDTARDHQRPKYLAPTEGLDVRSIHLVRDPRGGVASIMKHTGVDVATAAGQWKHYNAEADRVRHFIRPGSSILLQYEQLCADPQVTLDELSRFMGVEPAPLPEDLRSVEHHIIGNSMRLKGVEQIRIDESWRDVLRPEDLRTIARVTGRWSHRLGYAWP